MKHRLLLFFLLFSYHPALSGQVPAPPTAEPKTEIERFTAKSGSVIIWGFSKIGDVQGVEVEADEYTNAGDKSKSYGIKVSVVHGEDQQSTFVDFDEIDSLLSGIDYISKLQKGVTKLDSFQGVYVTRGNLKIFSYSSSDGTVQAAIESGEFHKLRTLLSLADLAKLADLIRTAQTTLAGLKGP